MDFLAYLKKNETRGGDGLEKRKDDWTRILSLKKKYM